MGDEEEEEEDAPQEDAWKFSRLHNQNQIDVDNTTRTFREYGDGSDEEANKKHLG
ncbi:unnamed protein product, partial [Sphenostylis stenocarpa]